MRKIREMDLNASLSFINLNVKFKMSIDIAFKKWTTRWPPN